MLVGYARVAPQDRASDVQQTKLRAAGCEVVFVERLATYPGQRQPELDRALTSLRSQDVLVVTTLDRLAGGLRDLVDRMHQVEAKGASVRALQGAMDTRTASGSQLLNALLTFDRQLAGERIHNGMKVAQRQGQHVGRPRLLDPEAVQLAAARLRGGEPVPSIARSMGVSPQTLRRALQTHGLLVLNARENRV